MSALAMATAPPPSASAAPPSPPLPEIRPDLRLLEAPADVTGARRWLIHDPLQHRFVAIGQTAHVLFQLWQPGATVDTVVAAAWDHHSETATPDEVTRFAGFLIAQGLTVEGPGGGWRGLHAADARKRSAVLSRLAHDYLFYRFPLFRPEPLLDATLPLVRPLGSPLVRALLMLIAAIGLYLVSREWDAFATTFADIFSVAGAATMLIALPLLKLAHELGHAYVARHFGARVPVIGVAFVLGVPMLYADVTDVWRLTSRRARMWVDAAGVAVDVAVAAVATFLWAFLPPGPLASLAFSLATAGWILSLTLNANPFMRFDGYHLLADRLGIDNLQTRAMALSRWRLRETLFALRAAPPEPLPADVRGWMEVYGFATWLYRLVLFTTIALAVYTYFVKIVGVILFLFEIGYFIVLPLWREFKEWATMRRRILASPRTWVSLTVLAALVAVLVVPWSARITVPAVLEASDLATSHPPVPARVVQVHVAPGQVIAAGTPIVTLEAPALDHDLAVVSRRLAIVDLRLARRTSDGADRVDSGVLEREHAALTATRAGLLRQRAELEVRAPMAGTVVEMAPQMHPGRWVGRAEALAVIRAGHTGVVRGVLPATAVWRVGEGARARFIPDDLALPSLAVEVAGIGRTGLDSIAQIELASAHGGPVSTRVDDRRRQVPVEAQYSLRAEVMTAVTADHMARTTPGVLLVDATAESLLAGLWRQTLKVLVRESGV